MNRETLMNVLRVFVDNQKMYGNPVGIILDENHDLEQSDRQLISAETGFSECVFINNLKTGEISIFNPVNEVLFAGHAILGTAFFLNEILQTEIRTIKCKSGFIKITKRDDLTWIRAKMEYLPRWNIKQLKDKTEIENYSETKSNLLKHTLIWSWIDQDRGRIRARTFAPDWGIPEDEANGSGVMLLAHKKGIPIEVVHGKGSVIFAKPLKDNFIEVGGRVRMDKLSTYK